MNVIDKIEKDHYVATEAQIETLAREHHISSAAVGRANSTYLRVLIVGCQAELGHKRGRNPPSPEAHLVVLERVHERFYAAVIRGVTTEDVEPADNLDSTERGRRQLERNRRSGFARSSATTLRNFIRSGGDIRGLDVVTVSKSGLQKASKPTPTGDRVSQRIAKAEEALLRAVRTQARGDPEVAAASLEAIMERLQLALSELLPDKPLATHAARDPTRTRVGVPVMRLPQSARTRSTQP